MSSLDTSTAPSSSSTSSSTMSNTQSSPNNAATDFSTNSTENLIGTSDAASTSSRIKTESTNTNSFDATDSKFTDTDKQNGDGSKKDDSMFECNICLDTAKEAVVSMCGHLFCWPCLHQWLETRPTRQLCPVCKAAISKEKVIPLYGRGSTKEEDPRYDF